MAGKRESDAEIVERLKRWASRDGAAPASSSSAVRIDPSLLEDPSFANGCIGKKRYETEADAENFRWTLLRARRLKDDDLRAYLCMFCGGWHLGH